MGLGTYDFALAIGGEAGQGIATPGDILARIIVRRGLHLSTYNSYQSIVRGGHIFLTMRISDAEVQNHGDKLDLLICLNQDTMDRHQRLMGPDTRIVYNSDTVNPGTEDNGADLCGFPLSELTDSRNQATGAGLAGTGVNPPKARAFFVDCCEHFGVEPHICAHAIFISRVLEVS